MHSNHKRTSSVLLGILSTLSIGLLGCPSAAPSPCIIQRPPLQGYTIKFTLNGTAPAGCEATLPSIFADNWRFDGFEGNNIWVKSDSMAYPDEGGPDSPVLGHGVLSDVPDADLICTIPDMTPMHSPDAALFPPPVTIDLTYQARDLRFLDGARYQGSTFEGEVDVTIDGCTGTYAMQGLTPSPIGAIGPCDTDAICDPFGDPANGIFPSGLNPDYAIACVKEDWVTDFLTGDPDLGICFFTEPFPGLK